MRIAPVSVGEAVEYFRTTGEVVARDRVAPASEVRWLMGLTIMVGVVLATLITLLIVPGLYALFARVGGVPGQRARAVDEALSGQSETQKESDK